MQHYRPLLRRVVGTAVVMLALMQHAAAGSVAERTNYVTFSGSVQLPGVALGAGTYVFELADPISAPSVVRVLSRDRRTAYYMGFTYVVDRPAGMRLDAPISLRESGAGVPPRVNAWWFIGERTGRQFVYAEER
jgi:hypothetical protein